MSACRFAREGERTQPDRSNESLSAEVRIARLLVDLAASRGSHIRVTQQQLPDLMGVSRVTTGQVLSRYGQMGLIRQGYRQIEVLDTARFARFTD